jgi:hypothetical protein
MVDELEIGLDALIRSVGINRATPHALLLGEPLVTLQPDELVSSAAASTFATSVLPTPGSPSRNSGRRG